MNALSMIFQVTRVFSAKSYIKDGGYWKRDKTAYTRGATVTVTVTVKDSAAQTPLSGASVTMKITRNGQTVYTGSATTDSTGTAKLTYNISRSASKGTYQASATVTLTGYNPGTGQTTFTVN